MSTIIDWSERPTNLERIYDRDPPPASQRADSDTRKMRLAQAVQQEVVKGGRVESQADYTAIIRYEGSVNHTLHLILTLITLTAWAVVWIALVVIAVVKKKTITLTVDEYGNVLRQQV